MYFSNFRILAQRQFINYQKEEGKNSRKLFPKKLVYGFQVVTF
jgi:hypothetical protein